MTLRSNNLTSVARIITTFLRCSRPIALFWHLGRDNPHDNITSRSLYQEAFQFQTAESVIGSGWDQTTDLRICLIIQVYNFLC